MPSSGAVIHLLCSEPAGKLEVRMFRRSAVMRLLMRVLGKQPSPAVAEGVEPGGGDDRHARKQSSARR